MVLDYCCAKIAVSSSDLRRMVPFRRINEDKNVLNDDGRMKVSLLETTFGADPMAQHFAILAGNTRIYDSREQYAGGAIREPWHIKTDDSDGNGVSAGGTLLIELRFPKDHEEFVAVMGVKFQQRYVKSHRNVGNCRRTMVFGVPAKKGTLRTIAAVQRQSNQTVDCPLDGRVRFLREEA